MPLHDGPKDFRDYVEEYIQVHKCHGQAPFIKLSTDVDYVPKIALTDYWRVDRIRGVLNDTGVSAQHVRDNYLITFSILAWEGNVEYISRFISLGFTDKKMLPLVDTPAQWRDDDNMRCFIEGQFMDTQWMFCPLVLDTILVKRELDPRHILPYKVEQRLNPECDPEDDAVLHKIVWDSNCLLAPLPSVGIASSQSKIHSQVPSLC